MLNQTINNEFRDLAQQSSWPFTADSALATGDLSLGFKTIIDLVMYPVIAGSPPYRLYKIDGRVGSGVARFSFCDAEYTEIGATLISANEEKFFITDTYEMLIGSILVDPVEIKKVINKVAGRLYEFSPGTADLSPGACCKIPTTGLSAISCSAGVIVNPINISAAAGVHFELDGDAIKVNLYGEMRTLDIPLKSINGIHCKHFWVAAHPGPLLDYAQSESESSTSDEVSYIPTSALRVVTSGEEGTIIIGKEEDFSYGQ